MKTVPNIQHTQHTNDLFSLVVQHSEKKTKIIMQTFASIVNTKHIPATYPILEKHLPSIFRSKCFNQRNYPFAKEVKQTEIGHLFEHILLEYLCQLKQAQGFIDPVHNGLTKWNWEKDEKGIFHINIDAGSKDKDMFKLALDKSISLLINIFQTLTPQASIKKQQVFIPAS